MLKLLLTRSAEQLSGASQLSLGHSYLGNAGLTALEPVLGLFNSLERLDLKDSGLRNPAAESLVA